MDESPVTSGSTSEPVAGLEGVVVAESEISHVDGTAGRLIYRGYAIEDLAENSTFEETALLLLDGELPGEDALESFRARLAEERALEDEVLDLLHGFAADADPMAALRTGVSAAGMFDPDAGADPSDAEATRRQAIRLIARLPTIVAAFDRLRRGEVPVEPRQELSHAANFLWMLAGEDPAEPAAEIVDVALILHAEHGMNASTFSARVTAATLSDLHSAITSAVGTLKGTLHGGANAEVMRMLLEIEERGMEPEAYVDEKLAARQRVMGFGHRVYETIDPRAPILADFAKRLGESTGESRWYEWSQRIRERMEETKGLQPNVDFFSASTYYALGIPIDLFTPIFAMARVAGWAAHVEAQYARNRLIRPRAEYVGARNRSWVPAAER
ncbi:MAG: citrate/2-methylcitrate synthase [Gemmatimonadota bacterium]|nr:citrate/2-methylcitrate synthase [Gemmatimonadota bacterium]